MINPTAKIHSTAIIKNNVTIGENCIVEAYSIINNNVILGKNNIIKSHCVIEKNTNVGDNNFFNCFSLIGSIPQNPKFNGEDTFTIIGNNNIFNDRTHIDSGIKKTVIGNYNFFMTGSGVAHDCIIGDNNIFAPQAAVLGNCILKNHINFGFVSSCLQGTKIGSYAMIGASTFVRKNVLPFSLLKGNPAELIGPNYVGLKRNGFSKDDIKTAFIIFNILKNTNITLYEKHKNIFLYDNIISNHIKNFLEEDL